MSIMTLKLPNSYVDVDRDEMEYVDGGWRPYKNGTILGITLDGNETSRFLSDYAWAAAALTSAAGLAAGPAAAAVGVITSSLGWLINRYNKDNSGVTIAFMIGNIVPMIYDN